MGEYMHIEVKDMECLVIMEKM